MDPHILAIIGRDPIPFETLISDLMTSSNEQRSQAESLFNSCKENYPNTLVTKLANLLEHSPCLEARAMSAILLPNLFKQTDPNTLVQVKNSLLNCVVNEQNKPIIKILGNTISELAADNGWPELMYFLLDLVESEDFWFQESALLIFAQLAQYVGGSLWPHIRLLNSVFMKYLMPHKSLLHGVFMKCLGNIGSADVRIAALSAAINFIQCLKSLSDRDGFRDLLPGMMQCLTEALHNGTKQKALVLLIELAETVPRFFTGQVVEVVGSMLQIAEAESLEEGTRHLAIEFVITLAETRECTPEMMRKLPEFTSRLLAILMRMLLDIEDDEEWNSTENESSNYSVGQECLHRLATALGGETIVPVAYDQLHAYLTAPKWQKHLAALVALAQIAKGQRSMVTIPNLEQVVTMVLNSFEDPDHPRVRWAAINAIGELSNYVGPSLLGDQYHDRVLPALDLALDDVNPRVQAHAVSFVLNCRPDILPPYLDGILNKLIALPLNDPNIRVLKLANSLEESTDVQIRASSAVELGKMFEEPLAVLTKGLVQYKLLRCVEAERNRSVLKSLCHTIATFYNALCIETGWPELFSFVNQWASGDNDFLKEATMLILGPLRFFTENRPISLDVYWACLVNDSEHIRIAAFGAVIGYIQCTQRDMDVSLFHAMTRVLTEGLNGGQEVMTQEALKLLIEWAHQIKRGWFSGSLFSESYYEELLIHLQEYFSGWQLVWFVSSAIEIAESQSLKKTRHLAIDFVITLGEGSHHDRELMINNKLFGILMSDIENEDDDAGESSNFSVLLKFLDRLAFRLDEDSVAWPKLEKYLGASEWRKRVIAINILALARISKVYLKVKKKNMIQLVTMVLDLFQDSHHRVRLAAINATVQLSTDLDPDLQLQYHSRVLPDLATAIYDFQYPQVQADAASAVVDISKNFPPDTLTPYLFDIVVTLLEFRCREDIASDQTRILAIENLLKQFREKLPPNTWASTWSSLLDHQQVELVQYPCVARLHAFVEYETIELAEKAALELNKEGNWRNSLKVRLLRRPAKPAQARGKKAGQEDEAVHKEDDTSTSEQHTPNEKHLDDTHQQSEVQSHEHVGEDHSNEKEGGQKKGRNRGRGKGRGRPQYNNHNNRGAHVVTPPSSNSVNNEHPVIGKQPPGPRMPDGTRGFSMGRGKPISVAIETSIS